MTCANIIMFYFKTFRYLIGFFCLVSFILENRAAKTFSSGHIAKCEYEVNRLGSLVADLFNAPIGKHNWHDRSHQDSIIEAIGFAPWLANGIQGTNGLTLNGTNAKELHTKGGWINKKIDESPYAILNHKWIYMFGDSTTRQIWASYAAPFQANSFARNAKEWTRRYCNKQGHRINHRKDGEFDHEGWRGPCGVNEVTCYISGYGDEGLLTWDWKHFPYEDYDDFIWSDNGIFNKDQKERRPDILTVQFGLHSCWHAHPSGLYSKHLSAVNSSMLDKHITDVDKLMQSIRTAVDRGNNLNTLVVILTSGGSYKSAEIDECVLRMNRVASEAAHKHGFAVLERGEIERRLMFKSIQAQEPPLKSDMHLSQPAQSLISTCLLQLLNCLNVTTPVWNSESWGSGFVSKSKAAESVLHNPQDV